MGRNVNTAFVLY